MSLLFCGRNNWDNYRLPHTNPADIGLQIFVLDYWLAGGKNETTLFPTNVDPGIRICCQPSFLAGIKLIEFA